LPRERTADVWRQTAYAAGLADLYLVRVESDGKEPESRGIGFDAAAEFALDKAPRVTYLLAW
jgi:hypothetical protein